MKLLSDAWDMRREEKYEEARLLTDDAHKLCGDSDHLELGRVYHVYMQFESDFDNLEKALELCKISLDHYKKSENSDRIAHSLRHVADLESRLNLDTDAERHFTESLTIYNSETKASPLDIANTYRAFAVLLEKGGKRNEAIEKWERAGTLYAQCDLQPGVDEAKERLTALR